MTEHDHFCSYFEGCVCAILHNVRMHERDRYDTQLRMHLDNASRALGLLRQERVRNQQLVNEIAELRGLLAIMGDDRK